MKSWWNASAAVKPEAVAAPDLAEVARTPALWSRKVTVLQPIPFAMVYDGRVAGQTVVPAGTRLKLIRVFAQQVGLKNARAHQWVMDNLTDLLARFAHLRDAAPTAPTAPATPEASVPATNYGVRAREVAEEIQRNFWIPQTEG